MTLVLRTHESISDIGEPAWARLSEGAAPFLSYAWLSALETTGCVAPSRGWTPSYLSLSRDGTLVAAAPAFLKGNSEGEFVFDYAWAQFAESRLGLRYYPKLVVSVPFTPATGPRLLIAPGEDRTLVLGALAQGIRELTERLGLSSVHILFPAATEAKEIEGQGFARRYGMQFHWQNHDYADFEAFLARFSAKRRHQIRRERQALRAQGTTIETVTGSGLTPQMADLAYEFYVNTIDKLVYGRRYLNRSFFQEVCVKLKNDIRFVLARDTASQRPIAGAFNLASRDVLYGRYWGSLEDRPFLHFNVCFYHSIEECIQGGLRRFEPGAGGEHKVARGFEPALTHSAHYLANPHLRAAVSEFLARERDAYTTELERYQREPVLRPTVAP